MPIEKRRVIVGISGASGAIYGIRLLQRLRTLPDIETHVILSTAAARTIDHETNMTADDVADLADFHHPIEDVGAPPASGSFRTSGMIIAPCSVRTLSAVAYGDAGSLLTRAADVTLKERRRLVLLVRETPLHAGHLKAMLAVTDMGGIIAPPVPAFYACPNTISSMVNHTVGRALDLVGVEVGGFHRWGEDEDRQARFRQKAG